MRRGVRAASGRSRPLAATVPLPRPRSTPPRRPVRKYRGETLDARGPPPLLWRAVATEVVTMDKIVSLCKRRGLIFPASEIYGGIANTYDYGHYGVLLKNNVAGAWWKAMIQERDDIVALDSAIIQHPRTWEASGHLAGFTDPLVDCRSCKRRFRADHLEEVRSGTAEHEGHPLREGPVEAPGGPPGLRSHRRARVQPDVRDLDRAGEGRRLDRLPAPRDRAGHLPRLQDHARVRAQEAAVRHRPDRQVVPQRDHARATSSSGRSSSSRWRWSSSCRPAEAEHWYQHWMEQRMAWYVSIGVDPDKLRLRAHDADELSHYSSATSDIEYLYPIGWSELEGIANRGDFDLTQHAEHSGQKLEYVDTASGERYVPHVIEPAAGLGSHRAHAPLRRLRRGRDRWRAAHRAAADAEDGADQGRGAAAREQGGAAGARARDLRGAARADARRVRHGRLDRQALSPPGRDRHALGRDRGPSDDGRRDRDAARPRHARAGAPRCGQSSRTSWGGAWPRPGPRRSWVSPAPNRGR